MTHTRRILRPRLLLIIIVLLTIIRPGDTSWVNDEPLMMEMALRYNHTASHLYGFSLPFTPCPFGLQGTHGERYGPLPIWIDQAFLGCTSNLILMVAVRAAIFSGLTALAVSGLAATLGLSQWFAVITMLSPWVWLFSRALWDSTWCIPVSAVLLATYARFLVNRKSWALIVAVICSILLPLIHLMGVAMVLPVLLHMVVFHRAQIWAWRWRVGAAVLFCGYLFWPYFFYFFNHVQPSVPARHSALWGWLFPLMGGHLLTLGVAGTMPGDGWQAFAPAILKHLVQSFQWISRGALVVVWLGMALATRRAWKVIRRPGIADLRDHLSLIAMGVWICQTFLDGLGRVYFSPHYYSGTWIAYVYLAWIGSDWIMARTHREIFRTILAIYAASLVVGVAIIAAVIARDSGTRNIFYGTSMGRQVAATGELSRYSDKSTADMEVPQWRLYPLAWQVLLELESPQGAAESEPRPSAQLVVKYRDKFPGDADIVVQEIRK